MFDCKYAISICIYCALQHNSVKKTNIYNRLHFVMQYFIRFPCWPDNMRTVLLSNSCYVFFFFELIANQVYKLWHVHDYRAIITALYLLFQHMHHLQCILRQYYGQVIVFLFYTEQHSRRRASLYNCGAVYGMLAVVSTNKTTIQSLQRNMYYFKSKLILLSLAEPMQINTIHCCKLYRFVSIHDTN